ncbi:MAG: ATP-binding protein [Planctomycetota bacterium]
MDPREKGEFRSLLPPRYELTKVLSSRRGDATLLVSDQGVRSCTAVVKLQRLPQSTGEDEIFAFSRFAERLSSIRNPHVGVPYAYGTCRSSDGDVYGYTVREHIRGTTLAALPAPVDDDSLTTIAHQVCRGLAAMHDVGIYHFDLKPQNVIARRSRSGVDRLSQCVIIDVTYRPQGVAEDAALNDVTLQYIAPELASGGDASRRSDLFSLGVLLYTALSSQKPFPGSSVSEVIRRQKDRAYVPIAEVAPHADDQLRALIERLLEPYPENRPGSAQEVIAHLSELGLEAAPISGAPYRAPVLLGRSEELAAVTRDLDAGKALLAVTAPRQGGVTAFLRELQDSVESHGRIVLTAAPGATTGRSLPEQLYAPVHELLRRRSSELEAVGSASAPRPALSTTELLDDLLAAARDHRIVLFVDDIELCDEREAAFLNRVVRQARATNSSGQGHCQVVIGGRTGAGTARICEPDSETGLKPLTADTLCALIVLENTTLRRSEVELAASELGGRPGAVLELVARLEGIDPADRVAKIHEFARSGNRDAVASYLAPASHKEWSDAIIALALWGDKLTTDEWGYLRTRLAPRAGEGPPPDRVRVSEDGVRACGVNVQRALVKALPDWRRSKIVEALLDAVRPRWRMRSLERLAPLVRFVAQLNSIPDRIRWPLCRAMFLLAGQRRFAEIRSVCAGVGARDGAPSWVAAFGAFTDDSASASDAGLPAGEPWGIFRDWIVARRHRRTRHNSEAMQAVSRSVRSDLSRIPSRVLEEFGTLAADMGDLDDAKRALRAILERLAAWSKAANVPSLRELLRAPVTVAGPVARTLARYYRVRARVQETRSRFGLAAKCSRRERRLHSLQRNRAEEAACLNNEAIALIRGGRFHDAAGVLTTCVRLREGLEDERGLVAALNNLAFAYSEAAQLSDAASALNRARVVATRNGLLRHRNTSMLHLGSTYMQSGRLRDARRVFSRLAKMCVDHDDARARALLNSALLALDGWHLTIAERRVVALKEFLGNALGIGPDVCAHAVEAEIAYRTADRARLRDILASASPDDSNLDHYRDYLGDTVVSARGWDRLARVRRAGRRSPHRTAASLERLFFVARGRGVQRAVLERVLAALKSARTMTDDDVRVALACIDHPEFKDGHDDLHIGIRALVAKTLLQQDRAREAWGLLEDALRRFRRFEKKIDRWGGDTCVLRDTHALLAQAIGNTPGDRSKWGGRSLQLRAAAFDAMVASRGSGTSVRHRELGLVAGINAALSVVEDSEAMRGALLQSATKFVGAQRGVLVGVAEGEPVVRASYAVADVSHSEGISWSIVNHVLAAGERAVYNDALASEELASHRSIAALHLRSVICVPIFHGEVISGALYLDHRGIAGLFGTGDVEPLECVARLLALELDRASKCKDHEAIERQLEEAHRHLLRTERSRVVGQVAGGVVHDLKNLLATVIARAQMAAQAESQERVRHSLRAIEQAARNGADVLAKLQECSRDHSRVPSAPVDIGQIAREAAELLRPQVATAKEEVRLELETADDCEVTGVSGEYRELFLNLMNNALDAMTGGGVLRVQVKRVGDDVSIEVADTGVGMNEQELARVFEPFYSTKGAGGTGLGLAIVRKVVIRDAGTIDVDSKPGVGTTFSILVPACRDQESRPAAIPRGVIEQG